MSGPTSRILAALLGVICCWLMAGSARGQQTFRYPVVDPEGMDASPLPPAQVPRVLPPSQSASGFLPSPPAATPVETSSGSPHLPGDALWRWLGGANLYLLKPDFARNTAYQTTTVLTSTMGGNTTIGGRTATQDFVWNTQPAASFWLGLASPAGPGFRARAFYFRGTSNDAFTSLTPEQASNGALANPQITTFINPSPGVPAFPGIIPAAPDGRQGFSSPSTLISLAAIGQDDLRFTSDLNIYAVDVEPTYSRSLGNWSLLAGAGGRYLRLVQHYRATLVNTGGSTGATQTETLDLSRNFQGAGPTFSGQVCWNLGSSGLAVFAAARGALLVGSMNRVSTFSDTLDDPAGLTIGGGPAQGVRRYSTLPERTDLVLPVAECEVGLEYGLVISDTRWFVRGAFVNHTYFNAGNASMSDGNLGLYGYQMALGVNY